VGGWFCLDRKIKRGLRGGGVRGGMPLSLELLLTIHAVQVMDVEGGWGEM
jgi:hypothetical protein